MLQQTTVQTVKAYYQRWINAFPTVRHVAEARQEKILTMWQGLGYYQRARNLHQAAQIICRDFGGKIPQDYVALRQLPGFGAYTTGAVLSIAFDQPYLALDANVRRIAMRQLVIEKKAGPSLDKTIQPFLEAVLPKKGRGDFNQALMDLGALICRQRNPLCAQCPIQSTCRAYEKGIQEMIPLKSKKVMKDIEAVVALIQKDGRFLIQRRPATGLLANLWEFPGGKVEPRESQVAALRREIREELAVSIERIRHFINVRHSYTTFHIRLSSYFCQLADGVDLTVNKTRRWVKRRNLVKYPMPSGSAKIVAALLNSPH